jgi:hypothetical protein
VDDEVEEEFVCDVVVLPRGRLLRIHLLLALAFFGLSCLDFETTRIGAERTSVVTLKKVTLQDGFCCLLCLRIKAFDENSKVGVGVFTGERMNANIDRCFCSNGVQMHYR